MIYNQEFRVLQYCDGDGWQSVWNQHNVPTAGLVAHWTFGDRSGTTARDSAGDNHGTLVNMDPNTAWVAGKIGGALEFDGMDDYVTIPHNSSLSITDKITLSAWVKRSATGLIGPRIIAKRGSSAQENYSLRFNDDKIFFAFRDPGDTSWHGWETTNSFTSTTQFYHVACSLTFGDGSSIHCYVNGEDEAGSWILGDGNSAPITTTNDAVIGRRSATANSDYFSGIIDDVRIYDRALSEAEIQALYELGAGGGGALTDNGLVARYFFDEAASGQSPAEIADAAPDPLNVTIVYQDSNPTYAAAESGRGLEWDAVLVRGRAELDNVDGTKIKDNLHGSTQVTIEFVTDPVDARANDSRIFQIGDTNERNLTVEIGTDNNGIVKMRWKPSDGAQGTEAAQWHDTGIIGERAVYHVVLDTTLATAGDRVRLYKNSVLQTKAFGTDPTQDSTIDLETGRLFTIGNRVNPSTSGSRAVQGLLGYFAVYGEALTEAQIEDNVAVLLGNDDISFGGGSDCTDPAGFDGDILYNGDHNVLQWCGGGKWHAAGPIPGAGGMGCSDPLGARGDLLYNADYKVPQYCDGSVWRAMGAFASLNDVTDGLAGWWKFDDGSGTTAADSAGDNDGTLNNMDPNTAWVTGQIGGALAFDGVDDYVDAGTMSALDGLSQASLCFWGYRHSETIEVSRGNGTGDKKRFGIQWWTDDNIYILVENGSNSWPHVTNGTTNTWTHLCLAYNGSLSGLNRTKLYVNGALQILTAGESDPATAIAAGDPSYPFSIGRSHGGGGVDAFSYSDGLIDDVRVYDRALSAAEIEAIYNCGLQGGC